MLFTVTYGIACGQLDAYFRLHVMGCSGDDVGTLKIVCGHPHASLNKQSYSVMFWFVNMEQPSCKNDVADVTTLGMDVIVHDEHLLGQR